MLNSLKPKSFLHRSLKCLSTSVTPSKTLRKPHDYELILISSLKSAATHFSISQGQKTHCFLIKSGFISNPFIQNTLLNMYIKCHFIEEAECFFTSCPTLDPVSYNIMISGYVKSGRFNEARNLFDQMPKKGCVSYTTMIMGFSSKGYWSEAIGIFKEMRNERILPNEVTLASLISACSAFGGIFICRMLHGLAVKVLLDEFVIVSTNLLHMYCALGSLRDGRDLFNNMPERNIVSWNVMLNGYAKAGEFELAKELFERIPVKEKDIVSWGTMVDAYVQVDWLREALLMFCAMLRKGLEASDVMIVDLVSACARMGAILEGSQLHGRIVKAGFDCYDFVQATIIHFYAAYGRVDLAYLQFEVGIKDHLASRNALIAGCIRNGMIEQARQLFSEMPERDVSSWSSMIAGYAKSEQPNVALQLFQEMIARGLQPNQMTMASVFSAIASLGILNEGRWAHKYVHNNSIALNDNLSAAIIDMYAKCGSISAALEVFYQIQDKTSTVSPWNAMICGLAMHGHASLSLEIYSDLERRHHIKQNSITFIGVLTACCHAGLVELGERYFMSMKSVHNIDPGIKHYGCMVDLLGRAGRVEEAEKMIRSMPMEADVVIWGTLLAACRTHGNVDIGEKAAENLARLEPCHGGGKVLLSNIYADAGRWEDVLSVRRVMQSQRMKKCPGYSGVA
ncbi:pentatricopeptide repeat-containing protein At5g19020, mitochondrial [Durio zibethinus]|uniref:Pentatricopeptide repeat-containing protein At5g19020, mitochondrial n=1 Tax=Durio zibethinus TaxID=66656 RepID=A0A6P6AAT3_DURZI|nr:pentatricopeptide repeat-containing protein At5g19020, mitochondrial [Durio zibethinus]XP_022761992.1 pentatricopeptide repeat-containing protein At5g19020, mitochondrial [Durio zibethinus]XP_022761993.1 pentatricopeptide repeat-containing protein At5g19020, mitochondrial [Durio zibethinus]